MIDIALALAAHGVRVYPISYCGVPLTRGGAKDATTNTDKIRAWWAMWPSARTGVVK
jgi:hypothetical protein